MASAPDTVTEAIALLQADGYTEDFEQSGAQMTCPVCSTANSIDRGVVERSSASRARAIPADEAIVLGVRCGNCGARGTSCRPSVPTPTRRRSPTSSTWWRRQGRISRRPDGRHPYGSHPRQRHIEQAEHRGHGEQGRRQDQGGPRRSASTPASAATAVPPMLAAATLQPITAEERWAPRRSGMSATSVGNTLAKPMPATGSPSTPRPAGFHHSRADAAEGHAQLPCSSGDPPDPVAVRRRGRSGPA